MGSEIYILAMVVTLCATLLLGYPVAFTLSGVALVFALIGSMSGDF